MSKGGREVRDERRTKRGQEGVQRARRRTLRRAHKANQLVLIRPDLRVSHTGGRVPRVCVHPLNRGSSLCRTTDRNRSPVRAGTSTHYQQNRSTEPGVKTAAGL